MTETLIKHSPLHDLYRRRGAECALVQGWEIARYFSDAESEARFLE